MYLIIPSKQRAKEVFQQEFPNCDIRMIIGELQTHHITVGVLSRTKDGQIVIEIPASLENWQNKIKNSQYANRLKTMQEINLLLDDTLP